MNPLSYIAKTETINTGGGSMVDVLHLTDGRAIILNDEVLTIYSSLEAFLDGKDEMQSSIELV